jgi:hypothetical protein
MQHYYNIRARHYYVFSHQLSCSIHQHTHIYQLDSYENRSALCKVSRVTTT